MEDIDRLGRVVPGTPEDPLESGDRRMVLSLFRRTMEQLDEYALDLEQYFGLGSPLSRSAAFRCAIEGTLTLLTKGKWSKDSLLTALWNAG